MTTKTFYITGKEPKATIVAKDIDASITTKTLVTSAASIPTVTGIATDLTVSISTNDPINHDIPNGPVKFKYIEDFIRTEDFVSAPKYRGLDEIGIVTESMALSFSKAFIDQVSHSEYLNLSTGKTFSDNGYVSEVYSLSYSKATNDVVNASESSFITFRKRPEDYLHPSEVLSKALDRTVSDIVHSTDDFYGQADIDDDQIIIFNKSLTETSHLTETVALVVAYSRPVTEPVTASENAFITFKKRPEDYLYLNEVLSKALGSTVSDTQIVSEVRTNAITKVLTDFVTVIDLAPLIAGSGGLALTAEAATFTDVKSITLNKVLAAETAAVNEIRAITVNKVLSTEVATVNEVKLLNFGKVLTLETVLTNDTNLLTIGKVLTDQARFLGQSIEFYQHSYFAEDYDSERYTGSITII